MPLSPPPATVDSAGTMPAEAYQQYSYTPATNPTAAIPTTGATGVYTEVDVTNVTSSIDPSITNIGYKRCHDNGHAATSKLVPTLLFPGFGQSGRSQFSDALAERMAGYVDPASGRAPLVIKMQTRGRGNGGTIDYARDGKDAIDILDHATNAVGSNVFGYTTNTDGTFKGNAPAIVLGYSTGGLDALNFAARFPDRCLGVAVFFPNYDIGYDAEDSYYAKQGNTIRGQISAMVQPGGDVRLTPGVASLDQYLVRNVIDAIARIVAIPNGPHVWLLSDYNETEALSSITRLRNALQAIPNAKAKTHLCITQTGDSNRILHADGANGASEIYAERYFFPYLLKNAAEWTMPQKSPALDLRLPGWMQTKLFEVWTGTTANPKSTAGAGGKDHAGELQYDNHAQRFKFKPLTSTSGYLQIIREGVPRVVPLTASAEVIVDYSVVRSITEVYDADPTKDLGFTKSWQADSGVTDSSGVTHWIEKIGGVLDFAEATNKPTYGTDANGKRYIGFTAASSKKLVLNQLLVNPLLDFTIAITCFRSSSTSGMAFLEMSHHGTPARVGVQYNGTASGYLIGDNSSWLVSNANGLGGNTMSINTIHAIYIWRRNGTAYMSMDGLNGSIPVNPFVATNFTQTGTNTTSLGAGWADGGGAYWMFLDGGIYEIDVKQEAINEADALAHFALMKSRWSF